MLLLVLGLVIFLGAHSVRVFADPWRTSMVQKLGDGPWKGLFSVVSIAGFVLVCWGYAMARHQPVFLWNPPPFTRHITALLMVPVFILFVASYVPRNGIKARLHHPQVLAVKLWALGHLLSNGTLADVVLFGSFLAWAVLDFRAARQRDAAKATVYPAGTAAMTALTVAIGLVLLAVFTMFLHRLLIGVPPFVMR